MLKVKKPLLNQKFTISAAADWPDIEFQTDGSGAHTWDWSIKWGIHTKSGRATTTSNTWNARDAIQNLGGTLSVTVKTGSGSASLSLKLVGTNPTDTAVKSYLATKADSDGFFKILSHETKCKHFSTSGEPVKSFDHGYGICQLTNPKPTFEQTWNWKLNIDAGLELFKAKRNLAISYLTQANRTYTTDQLRYETVCRWNGGKYHEWDEGAKQWMRPAVILCDSKTGNIGWNLTSPNNKGKNETALRARDQGSYSSRPNGADWQYLGVCYADRVLE